MQNNPVTLVYLSLDHADYDDDLHEFIAQLDASEQSRYERIRHLQTKTNFLQTRKMIKSVVAKYTNQPIDRVCFEHSANGKPFLKHDLGLSVSLAHTKKSLVVAVAPSNIGVDAEESERAKELWQEAESLICSELGEHLHGLRNPASAPAIFTLHWTALESLVKLNDSSLFRERKSFVLPVMDELDKHLKFNYRGKYFWSAEPLPHFRVCLASEQPIDPVTVLSWESFKLNC